MVKVNFLVKEVLNSNPFYAHKLKGILTGGSFAELKEFTSRVPTTSKHEVMKDRLANPPYGTNLTYPLENYARCHQTSGSTAMAIRWLDTKESWNSIVANWDPIFEAAGVTRADRFFFAFSFGPFLGFWSALEAVTQHGYFCLAGGGMSSAARLQAILDNGITVLCCTPTYAQHLGEVAKERKIDLSRGRVRLIVVAGEAGGSVPATRARIERLWPGATVFDHHGMTEVGPVTYQCPAGSGVLHVIESAYLAEVISPATGQPANPGETGELVLTTLDRIASPLLRYRTGDAVKSGPRTVCACGRSELALHGGILGRSDDMVVVRGVNVYPALVEELVRGAPEVTEYRVQLDCRGTLAELLLQIEMAAECGDPSVVSERLRQASHAALNLRVSVQVLPQGSLPRFEMKANRWVKLVN